MLFQTPVIIVNSAEVAHDLMDKRSANYSARPKFPLLDLYVSSETMKCDSGLTTFYQAWAGQML